MESFFSAAAVAAAGALAYVAYRHPHTYDYLLRIFGWLFVPIATAVVAFQLGVGAAFGKIKDVVPASMLPAIEAQVIGLTVSPWVYWVFTGTGAYLFLVEWVTKLIRREQDEKHGKE